MDARIRMLRLERVEEFTKLYPRFVFKYYGFDKYKFQILWDSVSPILHYNGEYYELEPPQGDEPLTVRQVLTYLGIYDVFMTIEQTHIVEEMSVITRSWNSDIMANDVMESTIQHGYSFANAQEDGTFQYILEML